MDSPFAIRRHVPNSPDALHCAQASLIRTLETLGHAEQMTLDQADEITGFREGVETWPYSMLAWLGENGYEVRHEDALDAVALMRDAETELRRSGLDDETLEYFLDISDFSREGAAIARCLASGNLTFVPGIPDPRRLTDRIDARWLPLLSLDAAVLAERERDGFEGHMVLVTGFVGQCAVIQDPGPPSRWDWVVPLSRVSVALRSPADTSGTITYIRRKAGRGGIPHVST
ncbi:MULTISPECIES: hypothetical protein [Frankia]|uniref:Peptidase C39-like domain-containing protein n=1 Tax=Frankia alni (strain DSM 45986 / CECT 9034 / ACN14a) TaxID=326424 RepID=Q0RQ73_FRAAA|nr:MULTISPECIES: hypothetical protein [Frankia]CAJ60303.1 hypothetical protein FRAAL1648 [Frankia alni ACN14a]